MKFLDDLAAEHAVIERVAMSFYGFACERDAGTAPREALAGYLRFFRHYAGRHHHGREEEVLFPALVHETEVRADRGPIWVLTRDHGTMAAQLDAIEAHTHVALAAPVAAYVIALLHHIDAENSVFLPECEIRFRRAAVTSLPDRAPDAEALAARDEGLALAERYAERVIPTLDRGDGCPPCPAYGVECEGIEREWWSEHEWEDARDRLGSQ